jgi:predicted ATP-binding protein involved in virulence
MQIAYCYIENDVNVQELGINFGSPYIFSTKIIASGYEVIREPNPAYVEDLFRRKSGGIIDNVSAVVGENGAGKTNLINFLMSCLEDTPFGNYGFLILLKDNEPHLYNNSGRNIKTDFKIAKEMHQLNYAGIYYNPIYDFQDYHRQNESQVIDVASSTLMYYDYYDDQFFNKELDMIKMHKFKNVTRQVRFILSQKNAQKIRQYITIPRQIEVIFVDPDIAHDGKGIDNISYDFRPFYKIGVDLWRKEKENIHNRRRSATESSKRLPKDDPFDKELIYADILFYIWKFIFFTQERNNSTLEEGHLTSLSEDDVDPKAKFEDFVRGFLLDQNNIFDATTIIAFIDVIKQVTQKGKWISVNNNGYVSFQCSLNQVEELLDAYDFMTTQLSSLLYGKATNTLMSFDWRNMSSGERAFLDLFARVSHAVKIIDRKIERNTNFRTPEYIYLFFDEAEVGFHLQWQKEYISILMDILPRIIQFTNLKTQPHIQLIFTTHSPISLSDIPRYNTVYLTKNQKGQTRVISEDDSPKYSFGANVHEIMYDAFYLKNGFTGNFSKEVIDELFSWSNDEKKTRLTSRYVKKVIGLIDDPILRIKLEENFAQKMGLNMEQEVLAAKIQLMQKRLSEIQSQRND